MQVNNAGLWLREQAEARGLHAWVRDSTDQLHNLQVQGPKSRDILKDIIWTRPDQATVEELDWFRFSIARHPLSPYPQCSPNATTQTSS